MEGRGTGTINGSVAACFLAAFAVSLQAKPLDLQMGARGFGMGGAYAAIADDASSIYWNPGGMTQVKSLTLSESNWILQDVSNVNVNYFSALVPIAGRGAVGGGWLLQYAGLEQGEPGTSQYSKSNWFEHSFSLAGAMTLWEALGFIGETSLGFSLNRYVLNSGSVNGVGTGFDLGLLSRLPYGFSVGLVARSLGADMMGDKIDPEYRLGLGYVWLHSDGSHKVTVTSDMTAKENIEYEDEIHGVDRNYKALGGFEYAFLQPGWHIAVRGGANNSLYNSRDNISFTGGLGGGFGGFRLEYAMQYFQDQEISLGNSHRVTLEMDLGRFLKGSN